MPVHRRLEVSEIGDVTVVRFVDRKIIDTANIQELGDELFSLVENDNRKSLLLNFSHVEFLSSAALNKLILLDRAVEMHGGRLKLCSLRPEIQEVFVITRLNRMFGIHEEEADAWRVSDTDATPWNETARRHERPLQEGRGRTTFRRDCQAGALASPRGGRATPK